MKSAFLLLLIALSNIAFPQPVEARLYFMHIPKTGGTTLRLLLEAQVSSHEICPFRNLKSATGPITGELVSGHIPYRICKSLDVNFNQAFKVTIFREPIARYLSFLRAKKKADSSLPDLESVLQLRLSADNKFKEGLIDNAMCRYLSADPLLDGEDLLHSAEQALKDFDCVIFFEQFSQDVQELFNRLGAPLTSDDIPKINTTEMEAVSPQLLEEVRQLNEWDIKLYTYARNNFKQKNTQHPLRTSSYQNVVKKKTHIDYTFDQPLPGRGWTYRETYNACSVECPIYRWVMDSPAQISFSLEEGFDYDLFFNAQLLTDEIVPLILVNGYAREVCKIDQDVFSLYQCTIPKEIIKDGFANITFYSLKAFYYRDIHPSHYNRNHPPLSFAVNRIQIIQNSHTF